jgi:hypothetical protein
MMSNSARFDRLLATATFGGDAHDRWRAATLAVVGVGTIGGHFAREAVRSGARCDLYDFDLGESHNQGTQDVEIGAPKAETTACLCNSIAPGSARANVVDVKHVGPGAFESVDMLVDCSDDPALARLLTELSNGWGVPLVRLAVDGTGRLELGRVLVSDGARGDACQLCASSWREVFDAGPRKPCGGDPVNGPPTYAGSALAMSVAGLGLLTAQRLIGGNGADGVRNRELIVDLNRPQILSMSLRRTDSCLSGHHRWSPIRLGRSTAETTVGELLSHVEAGLAEEGPKSTNGNGPSDVAVRCLGHPVLLAVTCTACSYGLVHPGTPWRPTPPCPRCGDRMQRRRDAAVAEMCRAQVAELGLTDTTCEALGLPATGALVVGRARRRPPVQLIFD